MADQKHLFPALTAACLYARGKKSEDGGKDAANESPSGQGEELCSDVVEAARTPDLVRAA